MLNTLGETVSTFEGYLEYYWGVCITSRDIMSTPGDVQCTGGILYARWESTMMSVGDVQYVLMST